MEGEAAGDSHEVMKKTTNVEEEEKSPLNDAVKQRPVLGSVDDLKKLFQNTQTGIPTNGPNPSPLTIFYGGSVVVFDGIPADKVREIMLIAAAAAAANCSNKRTAVADASSPTASPVLTRLPSIQSNGSALASPGPQLYPVQTNSLCKLQELPMTRRHSLQRFFEKRRDRFVSKNPYPVSGKNSSDKKDTNPRAAASPDASFFEKPSETEEVQTKAAANLA